MDRQLREIERRAKSGDLEAQKQLKYHWARLGRIPGDEEIQDMRSGHATGGQDALPVVLRIWREFLGGNISRAWDRATRPLYAANAPSSAWVEVDEYYDELRENIGSILTPDNLFNRERWEGFVEDFNSLSGAIWDGLPAPAVGRIEPRATIQETLYEIGCPIPPEERPYYHLVITVNTLLRTLNTEISKPTNTIRIRWRRNDVDENLCLPLFSNLPCLLQEYPVWEGWGN